MPEQQPRRGFLLKALNLVIGGAIGAVFAVPFVRVVVFPTRRRVVLAPDEPIPVIDAAQVAAGGAPVRIEIVAPTRRDAWARQHDVRLGAAWVTVGADDKPRALSATCPHLGCQLDYRPAGHTFRCPCHDSTFAADGTRLEGPAKRDMDTLAAELDPEGRIRVRFARFKLDTGTKEEI